MVKFGFYPVTVAMRDYVPTLMILPPGGVCMAMDACIKS